MKYNSIGEQLIAKAQELDPSYKPDKFNDMSEAIDVILNNSGGSGYKIKKLTITENGLYDSELEAYKPVYVSVPQVAQGGSLKAFLDGTKTTYHLFAQYKGASIDGLISYSDTANVISMNNMFSQCPNLTTIPLLDTSNVTTMFSMFEYCSSLTTIPPLNTSNVATMYNMFYNCTSLTSIPQLDTSNNTSMESMFYNCTNLISIPQLNTYKVINMQSTFKNCTNLTTIPQLDTSNVQYFSAVFSGCSNLTSIPQLNLSSANSLTQTFKGCTKLTSIGIYGFRYSIDITDTALEHDALVAFLNQAGTAHNSSQRITIGSAKLAFLSDEEKAIATNKGWTLA